jgi:hypothetical protein
MTAIPRAPLLLTLAGLLPFFWSVSTSLIDPLASWTIATLGSRYLGPFVGLAYGTMILSFMSGVLWGFATQAEGTQAATCYGLSVLPALWAFFMTGSGVVSASLYLAFGFLGVLMLDVAFARWGLTPNWWLSLRVPVTALVVLCLGIGAFS